MFKLSPTRLWAKVLNADSNRKKMENCYEALVNLLSEELDYDADEDEELEDAKRKAKVFRHFATQFPDTWLQQLSHPCFKQQIVPYFDNSVADAADGEKQISYDNFASANNCFGYMKNFACVTQDANDTFNLALESRKKSNLELCQKCYWTASLMRVIY